MIARRAALLLMAAMTLPAAAQQAPPGDRKDPSAILDLLPATSVTSHTLRLPDGVLAYGVTAGTLPLRDATGARTAEIFHVAMSADPPDASRPVTFLFNGGPGAASAFLMLGGIGPRMVAFGSDGGFLPPPSRLVDNPDSWLRFTDLVFVDPVGTGYSRSALDEDETARRFFGVRQDAAAMASFIRLQLARTGRTLSPVFLAGESYGGFRAAVLARSLQDEAGVAPSGLILISPALDFALLRGDDRALLPLVVDLPSLAAVNWARQGVAGPELQNRLQEVERWAFAEYLPALAVGPDRMPPAVLERLTAITGLPGTLVSQLRGRIPVGRFVKEYDRAHGRVLSRYDGMIDGPDPDPASPLARGPDPVLDRAAAAWTSAFVAHARQELGYATDLTYRLLAEGLAERWDYGTTPSRQGYADALDDLQNARALLPSLEVLVAHGRTDLVTPYFASRYLIDQLPALPGSAAIELAVYPGGHMMYMNPTARRTLAGDVERLYQRAVTAPRN